MHGGATGRAGGLWDVCLSSSNAVRQTASVYGGMDVCAFVASVNVEDLIVSRQRERRRCHLTK